MNTFAQSADVLIQALSRVLLHSVWQGALLALVAGIVIMATKRASAAIRYNLMLVLFGLFAVSTAGTFVYMLGDAAQPAISQNVISSYSSVSTSANVNLPNTGTSFYNNIKPLSDIVISYFNQRYILIVSIWFVLFLMKSIYMAGNIVYMQRVRRFNVFTPSQVWQDKLTLLCEKLQIKKAVLLLESGYLKVPVVIGYFKPVILIPVGMLAGIAPAQIEAVLLHELAHIKRRDNFVNFLQHLAEAVFFFNPGLLWISHLLREERENCCDDMAIAQTNSKEDFVKALISFKEHSFNYPVGSLAFSGRKSSLLNRVMRIVYQENKTFSIKESSVFLAAVAIIALMAFTFYPAKEKSLKHISKARPIADNVRDTLPRLTPSKTTKAIVVGVRKDRKENVAEVDNTAPDFITKPVQKRPAKEVSQEEMMRFIKNAKFDNSKFYSRITLDSVDLDAIQVIAPGSQMMTTLPHNAKVAFIVDGALHDEAELNGFDPASVDYSNKISGIGDGMAYAQKRYPNLDLSKYGAYIAIGVDPNSIGQKSP